MSNGGKPKVNLLKPIKEVVPVIGANRVKDQTCLSQTTVMALATTTVSEGGIKKATGESLSKSALVRRNLRRGPADNYADDRTKIQNVFDETTEETMTSENYVRLLQKRLTKECHSYFDNNDPGLPTPQLGVEASVMLRKRALNAIKVG